MEAGASHTSNTSTSPFRQRFYVLRRKPFAVTETSCNFITPWHVFLIFIYRVAHLEQEVPAIYLIITTMVLIELGHREH